MGLLPSVQGAAAPSGPPEELRAALDVPKRSKATALKHGAEGRTREDETRTSFLCRVGSFISFPGHNKWVLFSSFPSGKGGKWQQRGLQ